MDRIARWRYPRRVDYGSFARYDYISRTSLGEMTGATYIDQSLRFVAECPIPDRLQ